VYPLHGDWNGYVERDFSVNEFQAADAPCDLSRVERFFDVCIHAGDKRRVTIADARECDELDYGDALGAFDWLCTRDGDELVFFSRLAPGVGLEALVNEDSWKKNSFSVRKDGETLYQSDDAVWWDNAVVPLPDNSSGTVVVLDQPDTIYTLASSRASNGYNINADGIGLVTLAGAVMRWGGSSELNCSVGSSGTGEIEDANSRCLISSGYQTRVWIEGAFDGESGTGINSERGVFLYYNRFSMVRNVLAIGNDVYGVHLEVSYAMLMENMVVNGNGQDGYRDHYNEWVTVRDVTAVNNGRYGVSTYDGGPWRMNDIKVFQNGVTGLFMDFGPRGIVTNVLAASNAQNGIEVINSWYSPMILHDVSSFNNGANGILLDELYGAILTHATVVNNGGDGIRSTDYSDDTDFAQIVSAHNGGLAYYHEDSRESLYSQNFLVGNNASGDCSIIGGTNPGIDASCNSGAKLVSLASLASSFIGPVTADASNGSHTNGTALADNISDWNLFDSPYRLWGRDAGSLLDVAARGRCVAGETCRIWDFGLAVSDTLLSGMTGAGDATNDPFVGGAPCPAAVHGDVVASNARADQVEIYGDGIGDDNHYCGSGEACRQVAYLVNALELVGDLVGNDDGLCESGEACSYIANFGADPGYADTQTTCVFTDGVVTDVTMYSRPR
jgi:hypothetical protein